MTCLWPGLSALWWRGRLSALPVAIIFAVALNLLLVVRFIYPQWLSGWLVTLACWIGVAAWTFYVIRSVKELPLLLSPREVSEAPDQFQEAQFAFLQADWYGAEGYLMKVLSIETRDPPALLMLSSVYRHTDRVDSARKVIAELSRMEIGDTWSLEIDAELARIDRDGSEEDDVGENAEESSPDKTRMNRSYSADLTAA